MTELDVDLARRLVFMAIANTAIANTDKTGFVDDDPEEVARRAARNGYTVKAFAEECGLEWPMRTELLNLGYWSGVHKWSDIKRRAAARRAVDAGCPLRIAAQVSGLNHQTVANLAKSAD